MLLKRDSQRQVRRRGVILMVVLALLTLFAIVGISFVLFANSTAQSAAIGRQAENQINPDMEPELCLSLFLSQMIYDVHDDDPAGVQSALRGHSFARNMYGANFAAAAAAPGGPTAVAIALNNNKYQGDNSLPYSGIGRFHNVGNPAFGDDFNLINYMYFASDNMIHDPEHMGWHSPGQAAGTYVPGNAPYTYCDANSMFMAYMDTATGQIKVPSFHRESIFGRLDDPNNANWTNQAGKYMTMRPRMQENPNFPPPVDRNGDVKNLDWAPGGMDSIWIDIGAPVMKMADGRKYKMLVAPLILDLDGRINLNAVGNILATGKTHASNQGWGMWEVNPGLVLDADTASATREYQNLFLGVPSMVGRYGQTVAPNTLPIPMSSNGYTYNITSRVQEYAQVDLNSTLDPNTNNQAMTGLYNLPGTNGATPWTSFPYYPTGYGNANPGGGLPQEVTKNHPLWYNVLNPVGPNRLLPLDGLVSNLRYGGTGAEYISSDLARLCPKNLYLDAQAQRRRNQITLLGMDLDRPGMVPYLPDPTNPNYQPLTYMPLSATTPPTGDRPTGQAITVPLLNGNPGGEFNMRQLVNSLALAGSVGPVNRLNLNRKLTSYPDPVNGVMPTTGATGTQLQNANNDRTNMAQDIFNLLIQVTGAPPLLATVTAAKSSGGSPQYNVLRWLAQLAVNIVDYIDEDDYSTAFNWDTTNNRWVFGVELPRLLINEVYAQLDNDPADTQLTKNAKYANTNYFMNVWLELYNPLPAETPQYPQPARCSHTADLMINGRNIYEVVLANSGAVADLASPANVTGNPDYNGAGILLLGSVSGGSGTGVITLGGGSGQGITITFSAGTNVNSIVTNFGANNVSVLPSAGAYKGATVTTTATTIQTTGFALLGPQTSKTVFDPTNSDPTKYFGSNYSMTVTPVPYSTVAATASTPGATMGLSYSVPLTAVTLTTTTTPPPVGTTPVVPTPVVTPPTSTGGTGATTGGTGATGTTTTINLPAAPTVLLRRLACPHLPWNPLPNSVDPPLAGEPASRPSIAYNPLLPISPTNMPPNPYITVDAFQLPNSYMLNDSVEYLSQPTTPTPAPGGAVPVVVTKPGTPTTPVAKPTTQTNTYKTAMAKRASFGRPQPFMANAQIPDPNNSNTPASALQQVAKPMPAGPYNTFGRHNALEEPTPAKFGPGSTTTPPLGNPIQAQFAWPTHLDRPLISPMELMNVAGCKPHQLTSKFMANNTSLTTNVYPSPHLAPWTQEGTTSVSTAPATNAGGPGVVLPPVTVSTVGDDARLNRFLEFVTVGSRTQSVVPGGRVPGKININTMGGSQSAPAPQVFRALCDAQAGNHFTQADVDAIYNSIIAARTVAADGTPGATDRPFLSLAAGDTSVDNQTGLGIPRGLARTILAPVNPTNAASGVNSPRLMQPNSTPAGVHPYLQYELLNKIANNLTVRSNTFAIWMTVGFFEVEDENTTPVKLGAEINRLENRHIRHRMFALVDRTNLQAVSATLKSVVTVPSGQTYVDVPNFGSFLRTSTVAGGPSPVVVTAPGGAVTLTNLNTNLQLTVQAGSVITVDPNTNNEETVTITQSGTQLQARFYNTHSAGATVIIRGNPGAWVQYDPRKDTSVVSYFAVID